MLQKTSPGTLDDLAAQIKPKSAANMLLWGILAFFAIFVVWAWLTELDRTVRGIGRVIPSGQLQVVSNLEGGVIEEILVKTGMRVAADAPLIRLSGVQTGAELGSGSAATYALQAKIARLQAEIVGGTPVYPVPAEPAMAPIVAIERSLHASRMADLASATSAANARLNAAGRAVAEADSAYQARVARRDSAQRELFAIRPLVERGIEPRISLIRAESEAAATAAEAAAASSSIARAQAGVAEASASLAQLRQDWRAKAATELAQAQAEFTARSPTLPALADRLARTVIRAPVDGRINRVLVTTVGGTIRPGEPIVEIGPSDYSLLVEAMVNPKDIASVAIGQEAKVDITAYDSAIYGSLPGKVVSISPDAVLNERTGETHYMVKVRTNRNALVREGRRLPIGVGMVANVNLLGDKRSILEYLLSPITRLSEQAMRE